MSYRAQLKAVSPIIATLLLIFIAIVAALITYAWVTGYIGIATTGVQITPQDRIVIASAKITGKSNMIIINVTVQNIGQTSVSVTGVFLYNATTNAEIGSAIGSALQTTTIPSGGIVRVNATISGTVKSGSSYIVKVITANGGEASYVAVAG